MTQRDSTRGPLLGEWAAFWRARRRLRGRGASALAGAILCLSPIAADSPPTRPDAPNSGDALAPGAANVPGRERPSTDVARQVLVKFRKGSAAATALHRASGATAQDRVEALASSSLGRRLAELELRRLKPVFRAADQERAGATVTLQSRASANRPAPAQRAELFRWYRLDFAGEAEATSALAWLTQDPEVERAEQNGRYRFATLPSQNSDPRFKDQWHFVPAKVPATWQYLVDHGQPPGGSRDVVVAVVDSGVDYTHEDLRGNLWINGGEIPNNGVDDDRNGFVDDVYGCSTTYETHEHSGDPMDTMGHGTHVAGIVAAVAHNGLGGAGVAFNAQIMAVRIGQESGGISFDDAAEGILYATDHGAEVINMSWGGYYPSLLIQDALTVAFSQAVLVAAAGNDYGRTADANPHYPAAYPWVLGVVAADRGGKVAEFSNYDRYPGTSKEYEVAAPGVDIWSTLPGNRYAAWSGTSMASPIVAGVAALLRSVFADRAVYSSRYIMGQIQLTADNRDRPPEDKEARVVNPPKAIVTLAKPQVQVLEDWTLDRASFGPNNNGDGGLDAGETIHLAFELINLSGNAKQVHGTISTEDPFLTIRTATAQFSDMGPLGRGDNGFSYDATGTLVGVTRPFVIEIDPRCPNGHFAAVRLDLAYRNGLDLNDAAIYRTSRGLEYVVLRGRSLPKIIDQNLTLDAAHFWIVKGAVLVEPWATLTVLPGTHIQWGGLSDDAYNPGPLEGRLVVRGTLRVAGSAAAPVVCFPSDLVPGQQTVFELLPDSQTEIAYARIRNPVFAGPAHRLDHCYFDWQYGPCLIQADQIGYSVFHRLRHQRTPEFYDGRLRADLFYACLFDASVVPVSPGARLEHCVFLQDNENNAPLTLQLTPTVNGAVLTNLTTSFGTPLHTNGLTYAALSLGFRDAGRLDLHTAEGVARFLGGHLTSVAHADEQAAVMALLNGRHDVGLLGLEFAGYPRAWRWLDGSPLTFQNWLSPDQGPQWPAYPLPHVGARQLGALNFNYWTHDQPVAGFWRNIADYPPPAHVGHAFVLRLPGTVPRDTLQAALRTATLIDAVRAYHPGDLRHNAFLSKYWDVNVSRWLRLYAPGLNEQGGPGTYVSLKNNFWGTRATNLVEHALVDYRDNFTTSLVDYQPLAQVGHPTTYPFVVDVVVNGTNAHTVPVVGSGPATFEVAFNRDMDPTIQPFVTFGPAVPFTDFVVGAADLGWRDARTWVGRFNINPMTGEGYHQMRISGAVAAGDPWLVSGYDVGRFRFQVQTLGVRALTLQATGGEGRIDLRWQQDDFPLLAGYHLYRADQPDGTFARWNRTLILPGEESFTDTAVTPAVPQYYRFTVVTTDFKESDFSNVAAAAAVDTIPPQLEHAAVVSAEPARGLRLTAKATDNVRVQNVTLLYRPAGAGGAFTETEMVQIGSADWSVTIPGSAVMAPGLEYYLKASDGLSLAYSGTAATPHTVTVLHQPALTSVSPNRGPATGGTQVGLAGVLFQPGASVRFGDALALDVVVLGPGQLTCRTPAHFPATVDVTVVNPDQSQAVLLHGFRFETTDTVVGLPRTSGDFGAETDLHLTVANVTGLRAASAVVRFDPAVLELSDTRLGPLAAGWTLSANPSPPGQVTLSLASPTVVSGSGTLVTLRCRAIGPPPATTALTLENVRLNDGAIQVTLNHGTFDVNAFWNLAGQVRHFNDRAVQGATARVDGVGASTLTTDAEGRFAFAGLPTGDYLLTLAKADEVAGLSALDASFVLRHEAGWLTLSAAQRLAADVNRNGAITAMDASYLLEYAVGLRALPFPGAGQIWAFIPESRSYAPLRAHLSGQDFTAVLLGDVTGNWTDDEVPPGGPSALAVASMPGTAPGIPTAHCVLALDDGPPLTRGLRRVLFRPDADVYSVELELAVTPTSAGPWSLRPGPLAEGLLWAANTTQPQRVRVALAATTPIRDAGVLLLIEAHEPPAPKLELLRHSINEGSLPSQVQPPHPAFDQDADGLADPDERFLYTTDPAQPDTDRDGLTDLEEVLAGTDPTQAASRLQWVAPRLRADGSFELRWQAAPGRVYHIEFTDDLSRAPWQTLTTQTATSAGILTLLDPTTSPITHRFYRLRVVAQP